MKRLVAATVAITFLAAGVANAHSWRHHHMYRHHMMTHHHRMSDRDMNPR